MMTNKKFIIVSICTSFFANSVLALPILSEPNDIVSVQSNIVDIANSHDGSILQCNVVDHHLQNCDSKYITGMADPFCIAVVHKQDNSSRLYVTKKGTNSIYSFVTDTEGYIQNDSFLDNLKLPSNDTNSRILNIRPSLHEQIASPTRRFYISRRSDNANEYGQLLRVDLNAEKARIEKQEIYPGVYLPVFFIKSNGSADTEDIYGAGNLGDSSTIKSLRYPFVGTVRVDNGHLLTDQNKGGTDATTDSSITSNVLTIAEVDDKYWITHSDKSKFVRYDRFPTEKTVNNMYTAPSDTNVNLKKNMALIPFQTATKPVIELVA